MRADAFLAAAEALPVAELDDILGARGVVVVAPHPDDESLGCGGLVAEAASRGLPVRLVVVSDGTGSHPASPSFPPERLAATRERETLAAAEALGLAPDQVRFLRLRDRSVPSEGPEAEAAAAAVAEAARGCGAGTLLVTWSRDPHGDHAAASAIARLARAALPGVRLLEYPVWAWALQADAEAGEAPRGVRLDISGRIAAKQAAIAAHRSQTTDLIDDDPGGFRLGAEMLARFARPFEIYLEVAE